MTFKPAMSASPLIEHGVADTGVAGRPEELHRQQRPQGAVGRGHLGSEEAGVTKDAVLGDGGQGGQEEEQAAELGREGPGTQSLSRKP